VTANKVCPLVFRRVDQILEILVFEHPLAGYQLVKGTIEPGESIELSALRELEEESGIKSAHVTRHLGVWNSGFEGQIWAFVECTPNQPCPDSWIHQTADDGGRAFRLFWHPLFGHVNVNEWHPVFQRALELIQDLYENRNSDTGLYL